MTQEPIAIEVPAFVCAHVFADSLPILRVSREGGDWQCLCGGMHESGEVPKVVGLNHLIERDRTLEQLHDLPIDWEAERRIASDPWIRRKIEL
jgi:hypothetical protein